MPITLTDVYKALTLPDYDGVAAQRKMTPALRRNLRPLESGSQPRLGGVLVLIYCYQEEYTLLLTRRREDMNAHAGQISFPGGRCEEGETFTETALRETYEEVGVTPAELQVLGELTTLYIFPSDFVVQPIVAWHHNGKRPQFTPNAAEVAEVLEVPLAHLLDPSNRHEELWNIRGLEMDVPFFEWQGHQIWGATAMMLSEFLERLRVAIGDR